MFIFDLFRNKIVRAVRKILTVILVFTLSLFYFYDFHFEGYHEVGLLDVPIAQASPAVSIDSAVSTAQAEHNGPSPTDVWISDQVGYTFYVDSNGTAAYAASTDGGANWSGAQTVDTQTDVAGVAVWYDQWSPGDSTGTLIHILTWDTADLFYRTLDTNGDTLSGSGMLNISSTNQGGGFAAGQNNGSITRSYSGGSYYLYAGILDNSDAFVLRCSTGCTSSISNWTEAGSNPFSLSANDWLILMPLPNLDCLAIWWDTSADDILSREYEDVGNTWAGGWVAVRSDSQTATENTTYDAAFAATLNPSTNDIYLAYVDDANALGTDDDIKTSTYDGSSWSDGGEVVSNDLYRGLTGLAISYDVNTDDIYVIFSAQETSNNPYSGNIYYSVSRDDMATWSSEYGPLNNVSSDYYGLRSNLFNTQRIYASWYGIMYDDLFGHTVADLTPSTENIFIGFSGSQTLSFNPNTTDNYIGAAFTAVRTAGSANITSIKISETGTVSAESNLSNLDIRYETAATCTYDGDETLFGTDTTFDSSDQATVTGTMSVGTSQICIYVLFDIAANTIGTLDIEIDDPSSDIAVSSGEIMQEGRVKLVDPSNLQVAETLLPATIDSTVSVTANEHAGPSPTTVFTTDQIGYNFYVDADGRAKYAKTSDGGETWDVAVTVDSQTDVLNISVWYDQWSPGDSSGTLVHVLTADAADLYYTTLDTNGDSQSTTLNITSSNQGGGFAAGANTGSITRAYSGGSSVVYAGIVDNSDSFVVMCSSGCTSSISNWTEAGSNPFTSAANDMLILMPLPDLDCLAIWWDISADDLLSREFDGSSWTGSWTQVHTGALTADENLYYDGAFGATIDVDTGNIYLAFVDDNGFITDNSYSDILTSLYDGSSWTSKTTAIDNDSRIISQVAISYDNINNYVYLAYSTINDWSNFRSATVYTKYSTDGMDTWTSEFGTLTQYSNREILALRANLINTNRLYLMWYGAAADAIWGNNIRDLAVYDLSAYRFFSNNDSTDVGSPLTTQDTPATLSSDGQQFRLRLLLGVSSSQLNDSAEWFKLQYAGKGAGTCAAPSGSPSAYTDVTASTVISYAGNSPADGAALTDNASDPDTGNTVRNQTYEEANNFTNGESDIAASEDGLWDFSLQDNSAPDDTTYCFRVVLHDDIVLAAYSEYPEITSSSSFTPSLTFSISDFSVGFGQLSSSDDFFATGDTLGSATEVEAHTITGSTNASNGYSILVSGSTLTSGSETIDAVGCSNTATSVGTEQFGLRMTASGGDGAVSAPYDGAGFAYCTSNFPDEIASDADGDDVSTVYSVRYIANIATDTAAGEYTAGMIYLIVANY